MKIKIIIFAAIVVLTVSKAFALEFIVRGSADEMYDSNINAATEDPESDWITNLMLGAEIKSEGRSREFRLTGNAYYEYYANNKENSESYQDAGLSINKDIIDTVNFRLSDTFQHYPESKDFGTLFGRTDDDAGYISNDCLPGSLFSLQESSSLNWFIITELLIMTVVNWRIQSLMKGAVIWDIISIPLILSGRDIYTAG